MAANSDRSYSPEYLERLSSPDYLAGDGSSSESQSVPESDHRPDAAAPLSASEDQMDSDSPAPDQERSPVGSDSNEEHPPLKRFKEEPVSCYESSDAYVPPNRPPARLVDSDGDEKPTSSKRSIKYQTRDYSSSDNYTPPNRPPPSSTVNPRPKKPTQDKEKANHPPPLSKFSKQASPTATKTSLIQQIQHHWGPNFIKSFIPKCHRHLVKSIGSSSERKRQRHPGRKYESNPLHWPPSSLASILRIAKLTSDKEWLQRAMRDVVRHRIRHTRNRKPQLGRADFDVIEDMVGKGWGVEYAFEVRYKHLVKEEGGEGAREGEEEDVEYLFDAGPESSEGEGEGEGVEQWRGGKERRGQGGDTGHGGKEKKRRERGDEVRASSPSSSEDEQGVNPYKHAWCKSQYGMFPPLPRASSAQSTPCAHSTSQAKKPAGQGVRKRTQQRTQRGKDGRHSRDESLLVPEAGERGEHEDEEEEEEEERCYKAEIAAAEAELTLARLRFAAAKAKRAKAKGLKKKKKK